MPSPRYTVVASLPHKSGGRVNPTPTRPSLLRQPLFFLPLCLPSCLIRRCFRSGNSVLLLRCRQLLLRKSGSNLCSDGRRGRPSRRRLRTSSYGYENENNQNISLCLLHHNGLSQRWRIPSAAAINANESIPFVQAKEQPMWHFRRCHNDLCGIAGVWSPTRPLGVGAGLRLDADVVVHSSANTLLASEVSFRRLDRNVSEQELDLFQLSARGMTELRAGAPQIMWRHLR